MTYGFIDGTQGVESKVGVGRKSGARRSHQLVTKGSQLRPERYLLIMILNKINK